MQKEIYSNTHATQIDLTMHVWVEKRNVKNIPQQFQNTKKNVFHVVMFHNRYRHLLHLTSIASYYDFAHFRF